jgi:hypothetical protein
MRAIGDSVRARLHYDPRVEERGGPGTSGDRPPGVAVISLLLLSSAALAVLEIVAGIEIFARHPVVYARGTGGDAALGLMALLSAIAGAGLWLGSRRAWVLAMLIVGLGLVLSIDQYLRGESRFIGMAIYVAAALYLNQGVVRDHVALPRRFPGAMADARPPGVSGPGAGRDG